MQVKDIMTSKVLSVEANTSVFEAIRSMLQHKISGLPVVNADGALVGIVTEGDFLRRAETATERRRPRWLEFLMGPGRLADDYVHTHTRRVADVMTPDPYTVTESSHTVHLLQPKGTHGHAVFFVHPRETVTAQMRACIRRVASSTTASWPMYLPTKYDARRVRTVK